MKAAQISVSCHGGPDNWPGRFTGAEINLMVMVPIIAKEGVDSLRLLRAGFGCH